MTAQRNNSALILTSSPHWCFTPGGGGGTESSEALVHESSTTAPVTPLRQKVEHLAFCFKDMQHGLRILWMREAGPCARVSLDEGGCRR
jgi:hypothetical protein